MAATTEDGRIFLMTRYRATERRWVQRLLARLTPEQRVRYEAEMRKRPGDYRTGKKYDHLKAEVAERILLEDSRKGANADA